MKILFIATSRIPTERAMGTAIMKQCEAFVRAGIDVELLVPRRHNELTTDAYAYHGVTRNFTINYIKCFDIPTFRSSSLRYYLQRVSFFCMLCVYVWRSDAHILYTREPELVAFIPTRKKKFAELHHMNGLQRMATRILSQYTGLISITRALAQDVASILPKKNIPMHCAPSGIDLNSIGVSESRAQARKTLGLPSDGSIAMYVGSLESWKGYEVFLEAAQFLPDTVRFVVIGGSAAQIESLRPQYPRIIFLGFLQKSILSQTQLAADVFVAPNTSRERISSHYTSPLKIFEYMASGVPIVASKLPSIEEILSDANAVLVDPDNPESLARGIQRVIEDSTHSATIAAQAKKDSLKYDWNTRTQNIITFIHGCI